MKSLRHEKILEIIAKYDVETQEELTEYLKGEGFAVTQATVSRDIKALRLVKVSTGSDESGDNKYKYSVNSSGDGADSVLGEKFKSILGQSVLSIDFAVNMVVVKTYAGMANAFAAALDSMKLKDVLGTLAGDDTVLIIVRTPEEASLFAKHIEKLTK